MRRGFSVAVVAAPFGTTLQAALAADSSVVRANPDAISKTTLAWGAREVAIGLCIEAEAALRGRPKNAGNSCSRGGAK